MIIKVLILANDKQNIKIIVETNLFNYINSQVFF